MLPLLKHISIRLRSESIRGPRVLVLIALLGICLLSITPLSAQDLKSMPWLDQESGKIAPTGIVEREAATTHDRNLIPEAKVKKKKKAPAPTAAPVASNAGAFAGIGTMMIILVVSIVACLVIALLVWIILNSRIDIGPEKDDLSRPDRSLAESIRHLPFEMDVTKGDFRQQAQTAYQSGDFRGALIFLFSHVLVTLDQAKLVRLKKGKTNRQYLRELSPSPPLVSYYGDVMVPFEQTFFGDYPITKNTFEQCWRGLDDFQHTVKTARSNASTQRKAAHG